MVSGEAETITSSNVRNSPAKHPVPVQNSAKTCSSNTPLPKINNTVRKQIFGSRGSLHDENSYPINLQNSRCSMRADTTEDSSFPDKRFESTHAITAQSAGLSIYGINIRCLVSHLSVLIQQLHVHEPDIAFIQETWLDVSVSSISIPGYKIIARRD